MFKSLIFLTTILFVYCAGTKNDDASSSTPSNSQQLVYIYPFHSWRDGYWASDGADVVDKYFTTYLSLESYEKLLAKCSIRKRHSYTHEKIQKCISEKVKKAFRLICQIDTYHQTQYLKDLHLCFDRETVVLDDCKDSVENVCDENKLINYDFMPVFDIPNRPASHNE